MKKKLFGLISLLCLCVACFSLLACGGPTTFKVTTEYDSTKGTVVVTPVKDAYSEGDEILVTANANDGYIVKSVKANGEDVQRTGAYYTIKISANTTVSVEFSATEYAIIYELDGGENGAGNPDVYTSESATITLADASKGGAIFTGWTTDGVTEPTKNLTIPSGSKGEKTFTANYDYINYSIEYVLPEGAVNNPLNPATYRANTLSFNLKNATLEGYDFISWTDQNGNERKKIEKGSYGDLVLTASFEIHKYKITYELNGGTTTNPTEYTIDDEFELTVPTKSGATFINWVDEEGNVVTGISKGTTGDKKIIASWKISQTISVQNNANFTANGLTINLVQGEQVKYSGVVKNNKVTIEDFASGNYDITSNICGYDFTLASSINLKGSRYMLNFDDIFVDAAAVQTYTENGKVKIDLANGEFSKLTNNNEYLDMRLKVNLTESFYAAAYFEGTIPASIYNEGSDMRFGINMYNTKVETGSGLNAVTLYKHPNNKGETALTSQQLIDKEGSWTTFVSGLSFETLSTNGYWLIACCDKVNNVKSIYISNSDGTCIIAGSATNTNVLYGNPTTSIGLSFWKVEKVDEGYAMNAKYFRIASSLSEVMVTDQDIAVGVNNPDHAVVQLDKDSYKKGNEVVLTVIPEEGYFVKSITFNGENAFNSYKDGKLSVLALSDADFVVEIAEVGFDYANTLADVTDMEFGNEYVAWEDASSEYMSFTYQAFIEVPEASITDTSATWCVDILFRMANGSYFAVQLCCWSSGRWIKSFGSGFNTTSWDFKAQENYNSVYEANKGVNITVAYSAFTGSFTVNMLYDNGSAGINQGKLYTITSNSLKGNVVKNIKGRVVEGDTYTASLKDQYLLLSNQDIAQVDQNKYNNITESKWLDISYNNPKFNAVDNKVHYFTTLNVNLGAPLTTANNTEYCLEVRVGGRANCDTFQIGNWHGTAYIKLYMASGGQKGFNFAKKVIDGETPEIIAGYEQLYADWMNYEGIRFEFVYWKDVTKEVGQQYRCSLYVYDTQNTKYVVQEDVASKQNASNDERADYLDYTQMRKTPNGGTLTIDTVTYATYDSYWVLTPNK